MSGAVTETLPRVAPLSFEIAPPPPLPQLPVPAVVAPEAEALYQRITAPLATRGELFKKAAKKILPWGLGLTALGSAALAAMLGGRQGDAQIALMMGATAGLFGTTLFTLGETFLPETPRERDRDVAKKEALKVVSEALTKYYDAELSPFIKSASVDSEGWLPHVRVELDTARVNGLSPEERATLPSRILESMPESIRKLVPYVRVDMDGALQANRLSAPSKTWRTIAGMAMTAVSPAAGFVGGFAGSFAGMLAGCVGWVATAVIGGAVAAFISPGAHSSVMDFAFEVFRGLTIGGGGLGLALAAGLTPWVTASGMVAQYRSDLADFRKRATALLLPSIESSRSLLPDAWRIAIGAVTVGADERGNAVIAVAKSNEGKAPGDGEDLKRAIAAVLPKELRRILRDVPVYFDGAAVEPRQPSWFDRVVANGVKFGEDFAEAFGDSSSKKASREGQKLIAAQPETAKAD